MHKVFVGTLRRECPLSLLIVLCGQSVPASEQCHHHSKRLCCASHWCCVTTHNRCLKYQPAGASFFYQPGGLSYEAQEVRAYGLLLKDLVSRIRVSSATNQTDQDNHKTLQETVLLCTDSTSATSQRPGFSQLHNKLTRDGGE